MLEVSPGASVAEQDWPLVTVAMPVFNAGVYLRPAVMSIVQQTLGNWELLIIDDGSADGAVESIRAIEDPRITILRDGTNKGLAARLNEAIDRARGRYFARMDQDDISYPERLAQQVAALAGDPRLDLVAACCVTIDPDDELVGTLPRALTHEEICAKPWLGFYLPHPTWMGRVEWFRRHHYAKPGPYFCEDQELLLRSYATSRFATLPETLFAYRVRTRINWAKSVKTRRTLFGLQARHFFRERRFDQVLLAAATFSARILMDSLRAIVQRCGGIESSQGRKRKICYVVASPMTVAAFLTGHIRAALKQYDVTVAANGCAPDIFQPACPTVTLASIPIERRFSPWRDVLALWTLYRLFRRERFDLVHSVSPKAGLLAMLAAWLARVPRRVHTFTGQVWVTRRGWQRWLLQQIDRCLAGLATHALVDSPSQLNFLRAEGILPRGKGEVIGPGSICGVDAQRFTPDPDVRRQVRQEVGAGDTPIVLLFLGRINRDKGVFDLVAAYRALAARRPDVELLLVGPDEAGVIASLLAADGAGRVRHVGYTDAPQRYMAAADILCLPSYREGFGMVVIEAAAVGLPAVASRIYGITDAVVDGETGILHAPGDVAGLVAALEQLVADPQRRLSMGEAARVRALRDFSEAGITGDLMAFYGKILG